MKKTNMKPASPDEKTKPAACFTNGAPIKSTTSGGFTIIELLITLALSSMVLSAVAATFILQARFFEKQANIVEIHENTRAGMQMMTSELMMAGYDPTGVSGAALVSAGERSATFTADLNGDGDLSDSREKVVYALDEKDLQITRNNQPVAENITALLFTYHGSDGGSLSQPVNPDEVKRIGIRMDAEYAGISRTVEAQVALRNLL